MFRRRCRNRSHVHYCRRHGRHHHHHHHHHHHSHNRHHHTDPDQARPRPLAQPAVVSAASRMDAAEKRTVWEDNSPDSLLDIAARFVISNPHVYTHRVVRVEEPINLPEDAAAGAAAMAAAEAVLDDSGSDDSDMDEDARQQQPQHPYFYGGPSSSSSYSPPRKLNLPLAIVASRHSHRRRNGAGASAHSAPRRRARQQLLPHLQLPSEICEKLFSTFHDRGLDIDDETAGVFAGPGAGCGPGCARLRSVSVRDCTLSDRGLRRLMAHRPASLDVHGCPNLDSGSLEAINARSDNLTSLNVGNAVQILPEYVIDPACKGYGGLDEDDEDEDSLDEDDKKMTIYHERGYILHAPSLQRLAMRDLFISRGPDYLELLFRPLPRLVHLDLSGLHHREGGMGEFRFLLLLPRLASLVLHNVLGIDAALDSLCKLKTLRHLDISHSDDKLGFYADPDRTLATLVTALPELTSLDISGTNLPGSGSYRSENDAGAAATEGGSSSSSSSSSPATTTTMAPTSSSEASAKCDIPGLVSRADRPLDFLGLYKAPHEACCRAQIPAKKISGDSTEEQILTAGRQYLDRPGVLESVLNDLFHIFRYENCVNQRTALDIILMAMDRHPSEKVIQISGSASLYYVVKSEVRQAINVRMKRKVLSTLLNGMFAHREDAVMMRNGCLTLCQFSIPQDVIFDYERLVKILLFIVSEHSADDNSFVQRAGIYLLNSLACQVDGQQKLLVGNLGAMERMLALIRERVQSGTCDDVMETAWSCMWNVTDETPVNCKRFLNGGGMSLFLQCKENFPDKQDLLRNMMGLLGNVAEVPGLRSCLMTREFVSEFTHLLDSTSDGIEVSYNAAGVLAHMASDGEDAWAVASPARADVLSRLVRAVERWDLDTKRNINYRSFEPILRLVRVRHTPQCQHWAVWALANLTRVDPDKYCSLVSLEGGLVLLEELINSNHEGAPPYPRVVELASVVRDNCARWQAGRQGAGGGADRGDVEDEELDLDG